jgi:hypothetical protein
VIMSSVVHAWSALNKVGLTLAALFGLANAPTVLVESGGDGAVAPVWVMLTDTVFGLIALVTAVVAWRTRRRVYAAVCAVSVGLIVLTTLPVFVVAVPVSVKVVGIISVVIGVVAIVLTMLPVKQAAN